MHYAGADSHSNSCHSRRSIPEADITCILAARRRIPWHDKKIKLDANVEHDHDMPSLELRFREIGLLATPANNVKANAHREVEDC